MERKAVFLDIDGTLTEPGTNEPPESAAEAVRQARECGHYVSLCTGRSYGMLLPLLRYGFDGVIASAGGYVECQGQVIYDCPMTETQREMAMRVLAECGVFCTAECKGGTFMDEGAAEYLRSGPAAGDSEYLRWREMIGKVFNIRPMKEYRGEPVYKIVIMSPSLEQLKKPEKLLGETFQFSVQEADAYGIVHGELINRMFDKGRAIARVCSHLGIPLSDAIAFGDSVNDKEMLETAGTGICMRNGWEGLRAIADDICPPAREDGIREAFQKYHLIPAGQKASSGSGTAGQNGSEWRK